MVYNVAIIGGGAAGLVCAAIIGKDTLVLEKNQRVGKKLLTTGNGRCNFTNINITVSNYYGNNPNFVKPALDTFGCKEAMDFFDELGIMSKIEDEGKVFPYSGQASSLLSVLIRHVESRGVNVTTNFDVTSIKKNKGIFEISNGESVVMAKNVVMAVGGCSSITAKLFNSLGHKVTPLYPALVQLKCSDTIVKALQGVKVDGNVELYVNDKKICSCSGEILFTNYGVSGPPILQLSGRLKGESSGKLVLDLLPEFTFTQLVDIIKKRKNKLIHLTMEDFFIGMFNKNIGQGLVKLSGIQKLSVPVKDLDDKKIKALVECIKGFKLNVTGTTGFNNAQVTGGGAETSLFHSETMESKTVKGLYAVGEALDIYGDCGGYNLQWAWASAYMAGKRILVKS